MSDERRDSPGPDEPGLEPLSPSAEASGPELIPDLPAGIGSSAGPQSPVRYTQRDVTAALAILERAPDAEPAPLLTLTDEQLLGLDGYARQQFTALPWLEDHPEQQRFAASVGLRTLIAAEQVGLVADEETGRRQWAATGDLGGILVLRRTAAVFLTVERTVQTAAGPQSHRLHYYVRSEGVLEEEVTAFGVHHFTALTREQVPARASVLLDQAGVAAAASAAGEAVTVQAAALAEGGWVQRLADTRALSVLTAVRTSDDTVRQVSVYATGSEVLTMEAVAPGAENPSLRLQPVDNAALRDVVAELIVL